MIKNKPKQQARRAAMAAAALASLLLLVQGCATKPVTPEDEVAIRASARWAHLVAGEIDKAYDYMAPSSKAVLTLDKYKADLSGPVKWVSGSVVGVKCEAEKCDARIRLEATPVFGPRLGANMGNIVTYFDEPWLKESGQWWFFNKL